MHEERDEDADAWRRLGDLLLARRVELGWRRRAPFARHLGLTHDRTLADIELARRRNFDRPTLLFIERAYGWGEGSIQRVLAGGEPTVTPQNPEPAPEVDPDPVVAPPQDDEEILFRLPPGLTPRQRETARRLGRQSIETYLDSLKE